MRKLDKGFTIAEILISLGVLGVIAALAIPQVVSNSHSAQIGPILGRTVEQIELGCRNMIESANNNQAYGNSLSMATTLDAVTIGDLYGNGNSKSINEADDPSEWAAYIGAQSLGNGKFGFPKLPSTALITLNGGVISISIDTNADSVPNIIGKDIFTFQLSNDCSMIPQGAETIRIVKDGFKVK